VVINKASERCAVYLEFRKRKRERDREERKEEKRVDAHSGEGNSGDVEHYHQSLALKYSCLRVHLSTRAVVIQLRLPVIVVYSEDSIFETRSRVRHLPLKRVA